MEVDALADAIQLLRGDSGNRGEAFEVAEIAHAGDTRTERRKHCLH